MPLLRSTVHKDSRFRIRPAKNADWPAIERLLIFADRQYTALEWWTIQEWLGSPTFLLLFDRHERLLGLMLAIVGDGAIAWLRAMVLAADKYLAPLLQAIAVAVLDQGGNALTFLGDERWIVSKLEQADFQMVNQVITLRRRGLWHAWQGPPGLDVRKAAVADIDDILTVDHIAFAPMWWYSRKALIHALNLAYSYDVAYLEGACVGYQLSTLRNGQGHIVRLAVHPNWQGRRIGGRLLSEAMQALDEGGAASVTVNTQKDNFASLQLYRRFAFDRVGRPWAVWFRALV